MSEWQDIKFGTMLIESDETALMVKTFDGRLMTAAEWFRTDGAVSPTKYMRECRSGVYPPQPTQEGE